MSDPDTALLRWPSDDADRAVFYMGQAHIQEMARFYTDILGSHTLEFKHVNPAGSRCLELGSAVRL
jgi:hypothetical protein